MLLCLSFNDDFETDQCFFSFIGQQLIRVDPTKADWLKSLPLEISQYPVGTYRDEEIYVSIQIIVFADDVVQTGMEKLLSTHDILKVVIENYRKVKDAECEKIMIVMDNYKVAYRDDETQLIGQLEKEIRTLCEDFFKRYPYSYENEGSMSEMEYSLRTVVSCYFGIGDTSLLNSIIRERFEGNPIIPYV